MQKVDDMNYAVEVNNLSFFYPGSGKPALRNINLRFEKGKITTIIGPLGAGKTTLILTLNGLIPKVIVGKIEGEVVVDGLKVSQHSVSEMATHVGIVFDDPSLQIISSTVKEDVAFGPANLGLPREEVIKRIKYALERTRLLGFEHRNPRTLSGGEQQALAIAGIIAMLPKVIVMDEPITMLDPVGKDRVLSTIKELNEKYGYTIILTDSGINIEEISEITHHMIALYKGEVVKEGKPEEILTDRNLLKTMKFKPPQITELALKMKRPLFKSTPVTLDEALKSLNTKELEKIRFRRLHKKHIKEKHMRKPIIIVKNLHHVYPGPPKVEALRG
ncbi:MAG: ABC transporter, partial [Thermoproteota archaeon]